MNALAVHTLSAFVVAVLLGQMPEGERPQAESKPAETPAAAPAQPAPQTVIPPVPPRTTPIGPDERAIQFQFVAAPWDQVLRWFAEVSGLALQMEAKPTGTFSYIRDPNKYTLAEAMDILNEALIPQGFYLVRKGNFSKVISTAAFFRKRQ